MSLLSHFGGSMRFAVSHLQTRHLVYGVFRKLPSKERKEIESNIAAITDADLVTAVRPFMFNGRIVHELYLDPSKLLFLTWQEKIGAIISAFIISILAQNGEVPLSDQILRSNPELIIHHAKRLGFTSEVSFFLMRFRTLEDEWRRKAFPEIPD